MCFFVEAKEISSRKIPPFLLKCSPFALQLTSFALQLYSFYTPTVLHLQYKEALNGE